MNNIHYNNIIEGKDNRFSKIVNSIVSTNKNREDIVNDLYYRMLKYEKSFNKLKGEQIYYYIVRILKQLCANYNNKHIADWDISDYIHPAIEDNEYDLEWTFIEDALNNLSFYEREVVKLYYYENKTYRQISEETKIPITSLHLTVKKGLKKLQIYYGVDK